MIEPTIWHTSSVCRLCQPHHQLLCTSTLPIVSLANIQAKQTLVPIAKGWVVGSFDCNLLNMSVYTIGMAYTISFAATQIQIHIKRAYTQSLSPAIEWFGRFVGGLRIPKWIQWATRTRMPRKSNVCKGLAKSSPSNIGKYIHTHFPKRSIIVVWLFAWFSYVGYSWHWPEYFSSSHTTNRNAHIQLSPLRANISKCLRKDHRALASCKYYIWKSHH